MKRSTQNISGRNLKKIIGPKRNSAVVKAGPTPKPSHLFMNRYPFASSISATQEIVEQVVEKVNSTIRLIEENRYMQHLNEKIDVFSQVVEKVNHPSVDDLDTSIVPENEPQTIVNDHICLKQCAIERKKKHEKTCSSLTSPQKIERSLKQSQKNILTAKSLKSTVAQAVSQPIPLQLQQFKSQTDIKTQQLQTLYRQKIAKDAPVVNETESKFPSLLTAKKVKNESNQQFNFDYNGDRINIGMGMIQKNSQVNVLKTQYRIHKDRQEDVKNPKKVLQRYSTSRLPSLHSKKTLNSSTDLYQLKNNIQKSFTQKGCRLSSMKIIEENV